MKFYRREEDRLSNGEKTAITALLDEAFPATFVGRFYYKQLPAFRFIATKSGTLVGQVGVCHRVVRLGNDDVFRIFGLIDLAVARRERAHGLGTGLLEAAINAARNSGVDFVIACADDPRFYKRLNFHRASNQCKWLAIDERRTLGIQSESLDDCLVVLPIGDKEWDSTKDLDLLGYLF